MRKEGTTERKGNMRYWEGEGVKARKQEGRGMLRAQDSKGRKGC